MGIGKGLYKGKGNVSLELLALMKYNLELCKKLTLL